MWGVLSILADLAEIGICQLSTVNCQLFNCHDFPRTQIQFAVHRRPALFGRYSIIYNPEFWRRDRHQPFEVYKLIDGQYRQQIGGRSGQVIGGIEQEILVCYDESGNVHPLPDAAMQQMREQLRVERQRAERLAEYLRGLGIDPDNLPES